LNDETRNKSRFYKKPKKKNQKSKIKNQKKKGRSENPHKLKDNFEINFAWAVQKL